VFVCVLLRLTTVYLGGPIGLVLVLVRVEESS